MIDEVLSLATAAQTELVMECAGNICLSHGEKNGNCHFEKQYIAFFRECLVTH